MRKTLVWLNYIKSLSTAGSLNNILGLLFIIQGSILVIIFNHSESFDKLSTFLLYFKKYMYIYLCKVSCQPCTLHIRTCLVCAAADYYLVYYILYTADWYTDRIGVSFCLDIYYTCDDTLAIYLLVGKCQMSLNLSSIGQIGLISLQVDL